MSTTDGRERPGPGESPRLGPGRGTSSHVDAELLARAVVKAESLTNS
jgi:hypothetical protein